MASYTVVSLGEQEPWSNEHGQFIGYTMQVRDGAGNLHTVKQNKKTTSAPPTVGQVLEANITPNKNPNFPALLKVVSGGAGGGGGGRAAISDDTNREIAMQAMVKAAQALVAVHGPNLSVNDATKATEMVARRFWDLVQAAGGGEPAKTAHGLPVRNEPQHTGAPEPTTPSADYGAVPTDTGVPF